MNILIIISQYLPAQTPNTLRWHPLAYRFKRLGHEVSILTTLRRGRAVYEELDGIKIYRAGYNTLQDRLYDLMNSKNRRNETNATSTSGSGLFSSFTQRIADRTWRKNYWPDGSKLFMKPGIAMGEKIVENDSIDKVISVGLPFTCHLIGKSLKETHPELQWHMDIQDPFSYSKEFWVNNYDKYEEKNIEEERKAFNLAETISVTNETAKIRYVELFGEDCHKVSVIPPLFHLEEPEHYEMYLAKNLIHLTYCGSFYTGVRSIEPFLNFLSALKDVEPQLSALVQFHLVGQLDRVTKAFIADNNDVRRLMVVHGFKNRAETFSAMQQTDLLMNFGNSTDYHLPSKVVDFVYVAKPVVNFITNENDSTLTFLREKKSEVLNFNLNGYSQQDLKELIVFILKKRDECLPDAAAVSDYSVESIADQYL